MSAHRSRRISRKAAERLLAGPADAPGQLGHVLAAAAAAASDSELAREEAVLAAFDAAALGPVPATVAAIAAEPAGSGLGRRLTAKVAALSLAAVAATGGVALAASTGAFTGSGPARQHHGHGGAPVVSSPASAPASVSLSPSARASSSPSGPSGQSSPTGTPGPVVIGLSILCRRLAYTAQTASAGLGEVTRLEDGLASSGLPGLATRPAFAPLAAAAQGAANVPDYCGLLLGLPRLPLPGELGQLPTQILSAGLARLPAATLARVLASLPGGDLGPALSRLPAGDLGAALSRLPAATLGSVLNRLSDHDLSAVLGKLPSRLLNTLLGKLPADVLSKILARLPSTLLSRLSGSLLAVLHL